MAIFIFNEINQSVPNAPNRVRSPYRRISKAEFSGNALKPKSERIFAHAVKVLSSSRIGSVLREDSTP
jgi:hypothetical protein